MNPPRSAQPGGSQACSIQQMAPHISPLVQRIPNHGFPKRTLPAAIMSPCAGKYMEAYVGFISTWTVSKWVHITGVGFASRPCKKVLHASRLLKSSGRNGNGMGRSEIMAMRTSKVAKTTEVTAKPFRRASWPNTRSTRENHLLASRGHANADATAIAVREPSYNIRRQPNFRHRSYK